MDSSVAAYLLKQQGHEVIGLFMRNWNDASVTLEDECPWVEDSNDALLVAQKLGIPFQVIDMSELYKERIVDYMFAEYEKGRTPNPDILCNREVKFEDFFYQIKSFKFASQNDKYRCFFLVFVVFLDGLIKTTPYRISSFFRGFRDFSI